MKLLKCAVYLFAVGMAVLTVGKVIPRRWFDGNKFPFSTFSFEKGGLLYKKLGIHHWKCKLPDASLKARNMVVKRTGIHPDAKKLEQLICESCVAEASHYGLIFLSLPVLTLYPGAPGRLIFLLCIVGNLCFSLIQRYNRPRLQRVLQKMRKTASAQDTLSAVTAG